MPEVRWRDIGCFRDQVAHHYFALDLSIVWEIVQVHLCCTIMSKICLIAWSNQTTAKGNRNSRSLQAQVFSLST
ncbi:MAG: DUF86 domain-containing protein [Chloroflexi bacterium]|nr:DUF86 domain-containing protein [Chloroflexota bacterium]